MFRNLGTFCLLTNWLCNTEYSCAGYVNMDAGLSFLFTRDLYGETYSCWVSVSFTGLKRMYILCNSVLNSLSNVVKERNHESS